MRIQTFFVCYPLSMKPEDFVHLHCHSTYSLLEALPSPAEIVARAKELGQTAVGIADKGYGYGLIEFYQEAQKQGLKPVLGMDVYVAAREGMYYKPRVDKELLARFGKGLIALTGPIGGAIPQAALAEDGKRIG